MISYSSFFSYRETSYPHKFLENSRRFKAGGITFLLGMAVMNITPSPIRYRWRGRYSTDMGGSHMNRETCRMISKVALVINAVILIASLIMGFWVVVGVAASQICLNIHCLRNR